ncbi:MAG TPA: NUDIX hydrolase [Burkholderiaceae bacterium]
MSSRWKPAVTVAAVIERGGRFLLVEENTSDGLRINQPAGHLEPHESLLDAVVRETLEESAYDFTPTALLGTYLAPNFSGGAQSGVTYLRFAFAGTLGQQHERALDHGIVRTLWLTRDEVAACGERHRSPLVLTCIDDYLSGRRGSLDLLYAHPALYAQ